MLICCPKSRVMTTFLSAKFLQNIQEEPYFKHFAWTFTMNDWGSHKSKDFWIKLDIDAIEICRKFYDHYHNMWKNKNFFYDDSMLWRTVYDELVPKIQNNIDFLLQPK